CFLKSAGLIVLATYALILPADKARGAAFMLQENSPAQQGTSFAGTVAHPTDASTVFYNPAGMAELNGAQAQINTSVIIPNLDFTDTGSTVSTPASGGLPVASGGGNGKQPFGPVAVPNIYAAIPLMDGAVWAGLGITAPFGLKNDYGSEWVGRYDSTKSSLVVMDVAPSIAAHVMDNLSVGAGINIQRAEASLQSAIPDPADGTPDSGTDGHATLDGDGLAVGYNVGLLYKPIKNLRIGAQYRGKIDNELDGHLTTRAPVGVGGAVTRRAATADLKLPDQATIGFAYDVNDAWTVMARGSWIGWSNFNEIRVKFDDGGADQVTATDYDDSYAFAVGTEWRYRPALTLRAGFQYDETPTVDLWRSTSIPDSDRYWLSFGGTYAIMENFMIDFAATHMFLDDNKINLSGSSQKNFAAIGSTATVRGDIEPSANIFALSAKYKF
ncbi:MAG: outer membrane protein transport protein, partial [Proteobacteria bacterium]|nr:outer membrane protein transport protein [Pseudomonadota bacterium]